MVKQLAHICIMSRDLAATQRFYCDLLGLERTFDFYKDGTLIGFYLGLGSRTFIEVFHNAQATTGATLLIDHLCLEVVDMDATIAHIRAQGYEISDKSFGCDNTWQSWITDPGGVRIELFEYTDASSQFSGNDCLVDW